MTVFGIAVKPVFAPIMKYAQWKAAQRLVFMNMTELITVAPTLAQGAGAAEVEVCKQKGVSMQNEADINRALQMYSDTIRRICFMHLNNRSDVEDVFQEVFLKYALHEAVFESDAHERAWLIRVAINACKDMLKSFWRRNVSSIEETDMTGLSVSDKNTDVLDAVLRLVPPKYRDVIFLHYYEGYTAAEIAAILRQKENTIYTWLDRARKQLKTLLGGELYGR